MVIDGLMQKAISPTVSYVLLLALAVTLSIAAYYWGTYEINRLEDVPIAKNVETQMLSVDALLQSVAHGDTNFTSSMVLYYSKGVLQVNDSGNAVKYTGQLNAKIYEGAASGTVCSCGASCYLVQDAETGIYMVKVPDTNVYRGSTGGVESQYVEMLVCYDDIDIVSDSNCLGRSGPRAQLTARKIGYDSSSQKPQVKVSIC
jgi:hypothetical protein